DAPAVERGGAASHGRDTGDGAAVGRHRGRPRHPRRPRPGTAAERHDPRDEGSTRMTRALEPTREADFTFAEDRPFLLSAGGALQPVTLHYAQYGELNRRRDNVVLVCHALSGSARAADWWADLIGPGRP